MSENWSYEALDFRCLEALDVCMSLHRQNKKDYSHISDLFYSCCKGKFYNIKIILAPSSNSHDKNVIVNENTRILRLGEGNV